jgi:putative transposase
VILHAVFFYERYPVSYRDLQEILAERGVAVDHATLNRWVVRCSPQIADQAHMRKRRTANSWRVDETYLKMRGQWTYLYRAVDRDGQTIEIRQIKYLNNILEQDHRFIKRITKPMMGFKALHSASTTIAGIEVAHMIRKNQFSNDNLSPCQIFAELAA